MSRRLVILSSALCAVAVVGFWPREQKPVEPVYEGKPLSSYLPFLVGGTIGQVNDAERAVQALGTNALPWLMSELGRPRPKWRETVDACVGQVLKRNRPSRSSRAMCAMVGLGTLGPASAPALPQLARYLDASELCSASAWTMAHIGKDSLPYLSKGMHSTSICVSGESQANLLRVASLYPDTLPQVTNELHRLMTSTNAKVAFAASNGMQRWVGLSTIRQ